MKFYFCSDIVSQSSYFKSRLDPVTLEGIGGREPKILKKGLEWRDRDETWWKNKHKS